MAAAMKPRSPRVARTLLGAEVVTADGDVLQVGPDSHCSTSTGACAGAAATSAWSRRSATGSTPSPGSWPVR